MTSRQPDDTAGRIQASSVIPVVRSRDAESLTVTRAFAPLKTSALPYFPPVVQVAVPIDPELLFPEESATVVPPPSSNEYDATRPGEALCAVVAERRYPTSRTAKSAGSSQRRQAPRPTGDPQQRHPPRLRSRQVDPLTPSAMVGIIARSRA